MFYLCLYFCSLAGFPGPVLICISFVTCKLLCGLILILCNICIAPNPTRLVQSTSQFKTRMICTHPGTINATRNNQCNPDMQCSNTWTMDTSQDCKSNAKSIMIIIYMRTGVLLEGLGEQVGFRLWLKCGVCLCVADGERQIIPSYRTLIGEGSLAWIFLSDRREL